jgi:hypothetical protein
MDASGSTKGHDHYGIQQDVPRLLAQGCANEQSSRAFENIVIPVSRSEDRDPPVL